MFQLSRQSCFKNPEKVFFNGNVEDWRPRATAK